eukprot:8540808-Lingulodinium_polyedra.AAC.1
MRRCQSDYGAGRRADGRREAGGEIVGPGRCPGSEFLAKRRHQRSRQARRARGPSQFAGEDGRAMF